MGKLKDFSSRTLNANTGLLEEERERTNCKNKTNRHFLAKPAITINTVHIPIQDGRTKLRMSVTLSLDHIS
jgi:hypothetical protein